jgi:hypothetical protein
MTQIVIRIPKGFRLFGRSFSWTKTKEFTIAKTLNELTAPQLLSYCDLASQPMSKSQLKIRLLRSVYRLPLLLQWSMSRVQLAQLTLELDEIMAKGGLTQQKIPILKPATFWRKELWYAPGDSFTFMAMDEFIVAHAYYTAFLSTRQNACLDFLVATLYRPTDHKDPFGDRRETFNVDKISHRARLAAALPMAEKMAVLYYFAGCYEELTERYESVFSSGSREEAGGDWVDLMRHLPNEKFGTLDEIEKMYVHVVFDLMERMMKDHKKNPK